MLWLVDSVFQLLDDGLDAAVLSDYLLSDGVALCEVYESKERIQANLLQAFDASLGIALIDELIEVAEEEQSFDHHFRGESLLMRLLSWTDLIKQY